jgi:hypothetical protein
MYSIVVSDSGAAILMIVKTIEEKEKYANHLKKKNMQTIVC